MPKRNASRVRPETTVLRDHSSRRHTIPSARPVDRILELRFEVGDTAICAADASRAAGFVCAKVCAHVSAWSKFRGPRGLGGLANCSPMDGVEGAVGVAVRQHTAEGCPKTYRMDEVIATMELGDSLRVVDVRACSRTLRYSSKLSVRSDPPSLASIVTTLDSGYSGVFRAKVFKKRGFYVQSVQIYVCEFLDLRKSKLRGP